MEVNCTEPLPSVRLPERVFNTGMLSSFVKKIGYNHRHLKIIDCLRPALFASLVL